MMGPVSTWLQANSKTIAFPGDHPKLPLSIKRFYIARNKSHPHGIIRHRAVIDQITAEIDFVEAVHVDPVYEIHVIFDEGRLVEQHWKPMGKPEHVSLNFSLDKRLPQTMIDAAPSGAARDMITLPPSMQHILDDYMVERVSASHDLNKSPPTPNTLILLTKKTS